MYGLAAGCIDNAEPGSGETARSIDSMREKVCQVSRAGRKVVGDRDVVLACTCQCQKC
jgi:hypothetical protein